MKRKYVSLNLKIDTIESSYIMLCTIRKFGIWWGSFGGAVRIRMMKRPKKYSQSKAFNWQPLATTHVLRRPQLHPCHSSTMGPTNVVHKIWTKLETWNVTDTFWYEYIQHIPQQVEHDSLTPTVNQPQ